MKVLFLHQKDDINWNILWKQNSVSSNEIKKAIENIRREWYFISLFPEWDWITFSNKNYNKWKTLILFKKNFPDFEFEEIEISEMNLKLAEINKGNKINIRVIVPVEKVLLHTKIKIWKFSFYPAIDWVNITWINHELWFLQELQLSDEKNTPLWDNLDFLSFTLIDFQMDINKSLLYKSKTSIQNTEKLIKILIEEADKWLDLLRFENLNLHNIYWTFWLAWQMSNNFSYAYIKELDNWYPTFKYWKILCWKSHILTVVNNWLWAEINHWRISPETNMICNNIYKDINNDFYNLYRYSFRSFCQSIYNVNEEARFLQIIYAIDALSFLWNKKGKDHRIHITILSWFNNWNDFENKAYWYDELYRIRNKIVHENKTFLNLWLDSNKETMKLWLYFVNIINNITKQRLDSKSKINNYIESCIKNLATNIVNFKNN